MTGSSFPSVRALGLFAAALFILRGLAIYNFYFFEEDEVSIAAGAAALVRNNVGDLYRYTPQLGYYRLVEGITRVLGGDAALIPHVMKWLAVVSGTVIPLAGLCLFPRELRLRERWMVALTLAINPIVWKSSQYGNAAITATALATVGFALLTTRRGRDGLLASSVLLVAGVLCRADTVLVLPAAVLVVFLQRNLAAAVGWAGWLGILLAGCYGSIFLLDGRVDDGVGATAAHLFNSHLTTRFWELLLWAISPLPLLLAIWGLRAALQREDLLGLVLVAWAAPVLAFYFGSVTTCRYFLLATPAAAVATALGMSDLATLLSRWLRPRIAETLALVAATTHLVVGLGEFTPDSVLAPFAAPRTMTHDGPMPTGALLAETYYSRHFGVFGQSLAHPGFGRAEHPNWEGPMFRKEIALLRDRGAKRVVILLHGGFGHAFHFHAQAAGFDYLERQPSDPSLPFSSLTRLRAGATEIVTVGAGGPHFLEIETLPVSAGDEVWSHFQSDQAAQQILDRLPPGLSLSRPLTSFHPTITIYRIEQRAQND